MMVGTSRTLLSLPSQTDGPCPLAATASLLLGLLLIYFGPYKRATDYEIVENRTGVVVTQPPVKGSKWSRRFKKADQSQSYNV